MLCPFSSLLARASAHQGQGHCKLPHRLCRGPALLSPPGPLGFWWLFITALSRDLLPFNCPSSKEYLIHRVNVSRPTHTICFLLIYRFILFTRTVIYLHSSWFKRFAKEEDESLIHRVHFPRRRPPEEPAHTDVLCTFPGLAYARRLISKRMFYPSPLIQKVKYISLSSFSAANPESPTCNL